ncbi:phage tail P2-like protein [Sphingomonas sp. PP-F2F-G114-C0414]|uniref:phage tail protein I n=1 Tax=Sphingomonas sp. PP-F2F-G114-C0414 TaxID=2135662 RepID=UPI000EF8939C|nr:phage tail protein I [Sphingomonas sp. PP-F2F-G114-C0414]RMB26248.1 phage tail P2-like protein [Sphingomonas sp. PP-F2F-G114-C0414]
MTLLPPNATPLERAIEAATARVGDVTAPIDTLFDPATIPAEWLPWLGWGLSLDSWDADWSEAVKRQAVASSIALHRIKGTRASVEIVLRRFDQLAYVIEWFEATPRAAPHTFEVMLPLTVDGTAPGGTRATAAFAEAIIREVSRTKPLREHFRLVQLLAVAGTIGVMGAVRATQSLRQDATLTTAPAAPWDAYLQTEDGEPLEDDAGRFIEDDA